MNMPNANGSLKGPEPPVATELRNKLRDDLGKLLLLAIPAFAVQQLLLLLLGLLKTPWHVAAVLAPLLVVSIGAFWCLFQGRPQVVLLPRRFLAFFVAWCLVFSVAAGTDLLNWKRDLVGYEKQIPPNFLALNRLGDWHYWFAPEAPEANDLLLLLLPTIGRSREAVRYDLAQLIGQASRGSKGVAIDLQLEVGTAMDAVLCQAIADSEKAGTPVFLGYGHREESDGRISRVPLSEELETCVQPGHLGHVAGYADWDGRIRSIPIFLRGDRDLPALSRRVANRWIDLLGKDEASPAPTGLLSFMRPARISRLLHISVRGDQTCLPSRDRLRDQFLWVGSDSSTDQHSTPFGKLYGVQIHAWVAHGIATGHWLERLPPGWTFPEVYLLCYLLLLAWVREARGQKLLLIATALSMVVVIVAIVAIRFSRTWIDVSYCLTAVWLLALLLVLWEQKNSKSVPFGKRPTDPTVAETTPPPLPALPAP